jgi:hypothetical protein
MKGDYCSRGMIPVTIRFAHCPKFPNANALQKKPPVKSAAMGFLPVYAGMLL